MADDGIDDETRRRQELLSQMARRSSAAEDRAQRLAWLSSPEGHRYIEENSHWWFDHPDGEGRRWLATPAGAEWLRSSASANAKSDVERAFGISQQAYHDQQETGVSDDRGYVRLPGRQNGRRGSQDATKNLVIYGVVAVGALVGFLFLKDALTPAVTNSVFAQDCITGEGYDKSCKGRRAVLTGELEGDDNQWRLLIGSEALNVELEPGKADVVAGQVVEVAGRFERGGITDREEIRPARVSRTLSSKDEAGQRLAARAAQAEAADLRERCIGRPDPQLMMLGGTCERRGPYAFPEATSCAASLYELERRCRAAGY